MLNYGYILILLTVTFCAVHSQNVINIPVGNLLHMQKGNGWPTEIHVAEGYEALLKLKLTVPGQLSCTVITPTGVHFDVSSPPSNRFERWTDNECGVRVKNAVKEDEGRWRLISAKGNDSLTGWTEFFIANGPANYSASTISVHDGDTDKEIDLTTLSNSYCLVTQPFSQSSLIPGHCSVTLPKASRVVQGNWGVVLGLPGRVSELHYTKYVDVNTERLDFGFKYDAEENKLNLYCNVLHTEKNITFCRFQKTNSATGYNLAEGLSDGRHSYYGDGFLKRQCGMTIQNPTNNDYGTWQCSVGVQQWVGTTIVQKIPMQALISISNTQSRDQATSRFKRSDVNDDEITTTFIQEGVSFTLMCKADHSLKYCWFEHVNGTHYTPTPKVDDDQSFWYTGESLQTGDCGITFSRSSQNEAGLWLCHMGPMDQVGIEITNKIDVRVTGPLAANRKEIATKDGESVTLYCHTANGNKPLDYCRFVSPSVLGISIDESVTIDNAILGRYYFTENRSLDYGDCSLTIKSVTSEDLGQWTCAALVHEQIFESNDVMRVYVQESNRTYRATIIGMSVGIAGLAFVLVGVFIYRRGLSNIWPYRRQNQGTSVGDFSLRSISSAGSIDSGSSESVNRSVEPNDFEPDVLTPPPLPPRN